MLMQNFGGTKKGDFSIFEKGLFRCLKRSISTIKVYVIFTCFVSKQNLSNPPTVGYSPID